jgi:xanthine dehydrogenase accessory factor
MNRWQTVKATLERDEACVLVKVASTQGSVPRETDAWMLITENGFHGTIGGGTLEWHAMAEAQSLLRKGGSAKRVEYVLGPDLGQCCGGRVTLVSERLTKADASRFCEDEEERRAVFLFGAGHVGRALVLALAPLPFDVQWVDPRPNAFPNHTPQNVKMLQPDDPLHLLQDAKSGSLCFVMSHSHVLDLAVVDAALRLPSIVHVGLIGSGTKRARFEKRLREAGVSEARIENLICPIGVTGISSKHPAAIAAAVVAQILQLDAALSAQSDINQTKRIQES